VGITFPPTPQYFSVSRAMWDGSGGISGRSSSGRSGKRIDPRRRTRAATAPGLGALAGFSAVAVCAAGMSSSAGSRWMVQGINFGARFAAVFFAIAHSSIRRRCGQEVLHWGQATVRVS
jgi:hypothetical protein